MVSVHIDSWVTVHPSQDSWREAAVLACVSEARDWRSSDRTMQCCVSYGCLSDMFLPACLLWGSQAHREA